MLGNIGNLSNNNFEMKIFNEVYDDFIKIKTYISSRNHSDHWRGSNSKQAQCSKKSGKKVQFWEVILQRLKSTFFLKFFLTEWKLKKIKKL